MERRDMVYKRPGYASGALGEDARLHWAIAAGQAVIYSTYDVRALEGHEEAVRSGPAGWRRWRWWWW